MRRREFVGLVVGAAALPLAARSQQGERMRRIGVLMPTAEDDPRWQAYAAAFRDGLRKLGWLEGRNIRIDQRWAAGNADRLRVYAAELVGLSPDVMLAGGIAALAPLQEATDTMPIVFAAASDPSAAGFVTNLARPGGNITGFVFLEPAIGVKWLELLKEIAPRITRVAFISDHANPAWSSYFRAIEAGALSFGVAGSSVDVHNLDEIERAIAVFAREPNGGLIIGPGPAINVYRGQIITAKALGLEVPLALLIRADELIE
jgi:ABC-type uncharacterized transport system substrate-binding protein